MGWDDSMDDKGDGQPTRWRRFVPFFFLEPSATVLERVSTCNLQLATCRPDPLGIGVAFEESGLTGLRFLERGGIAGFNVQMLAHGVEMWRQLELPRYVLKAAWIGASGRDSLHVLYSNAGFHQVT